MAGGYAGVTPLMWLAAVVVIAGFAITIISNKFLDPLSIVGIVLVLGARSIFDRAKAAASEGGGL